MAWMGTMSSVVYQVFLIVFALCSTYICLNQKVNFTLSYLIGITVWIILNVVLVRYILKEGLKIDVTDKEKEDSNLLGSGLIEKRNCKELEK